MSTIDIASTTNSILEQAALINITESGTAASDATPTPLKRPASPDIDDDRKNRKRKKEGMDGNSDGQVDGQPLRPIDGQALVNDLAQELQCGCCAALVYKPVVVVPCDHFFCGSCCTLWVKNGGTNCPACRSVSTAVMPSRPLQTMVDVLLRAAPHLQRPERERIQADEIYSVPRPFRIPAPREPSPEPVIPPTTDFVQPCPHCAPNNPFHWACPQPIADPASDPDHAWRVDSGAPPGHGFCGNCEVILALQAPSTTRCDFCFVSFCGINIQSRCIALPVTAQTPHGMSDVGDLIQSPEIYDMFEGNTVEVELMLDYMTNQRVSPKQVYRQIASHIQLQPDGFRPLIEQELFVDMHPVPGGIETDPNAPRRLICRLCATEVFLYGLRDWWVRERRKAVEEGKLPARKDCPDGASCENISDPGHAKEFNHLLAPLNTDSDSGPSPLANTSTSSASSSNTALALDGEMLPVPPPPSTAIDSLFLPPISSSDHRSHPFPHMSRTSSSADLPSISNLVAELGGSHSHGHERPPPPRFNLPNDFFVRFVAGSSGSGLEDEQQRPIETMQEQRAGTPSALGLGPGPSGDFPAGRPPQAQAQSQADERIGANPGRMEPEMNLRTRIDMHMHGDDVFGGPSTSSFQSHSHSQPQSQSHSQHSIEAQLAQDFLAEYGSGSDDEDRRLGEPSTSHGDASANFNTLDTDLSRPIVSGHSGTEETEAEAGARLDAYYATTFVRPEELQRPQSPPKAETVSGDVSMVGTQLHYESYLHPQVESHSYPHPHPQSHSQSLMNPHAHSHLHARTSTSSAFASLAFFQDPMGYAPPSETVTESSAPPTTNAYPVRVE